MNARVSGGERWPIPRMGDYPVAATVPQESKEDEMPGKSKPSPSRSARGTNPPGGGYGKGGKKANPAKPKPGRAK